MQKLPSANVHLQKKVWQKIIEYVIKIKDLFPGTDLDVIKRVFEIH